MKISVVIPVYNEEDRIGKCLESLLKQQEKADEIIVVDNNCTDKTVPIAKKLGAKVVLEKKQGIVFARNKGFDSACFDIIARTDSDTILPPDWILKIKEEFNKNKSLDALSGPLYFDAPVVIYQIAHLLHLALCRLIKFSGFNNLNGPNFALKKEIWEKVKNQVCTNTQIAEDIDLAWHLRDNHFNIKFDNNLTVLTSFRRWINPLSYFYQIRALIKSLTHKKSTQS